MLPDVERDALMKTIRDAIRQSVPTAIETRGPDGVLAYSILREGALEQFCSLDVQPDHLELRFTECPDIAVPGAGVERGPGKGACRLVIGKRADIPDELLSSVLRAAAALA